MASVQRSRGGTAHSSRKSRWVGAGVQGTTRGPSRGFAVDDTICRHRADRPQGLPPGAEQWRRGSRGSCRHPMTACCEQRGGNNDAGSQGCRRIRCSADACFCNGQVHLRAALLHLHMCPCRSQTALGIGGGAADLRRQLGLRVCQPASAPHLLFCRNGAEILCLADLTALPRLRGPQP